MQQPTSPEDFGTYLKSLREASGLTLRAVEERTASAVKNGYLSQIEKGQINRPSPGILFELAKVYGVEYSELLLRAGHRVPGRKVTPEERAIDSLPLHAFAELDEEDRQTLIEFAAFLRQRRKDRPSE